MVTITEVSSVDHGQQPGEVLPQGQGRAREQVQRPDKGPPGLERYVIGPDNGDEHNEQANGNSDLENLYIFENPNVSNGTQNATNASNVVQTSVSENQECHVRSWPCRLPVLVPIACQTICSEAHMFPD